MANINIYGVLHNNTPEGIIAKAAQIKDDALNKTQAELNQDIHHHYGDFDALAEGTVIKKNGLVNGSNGVTYLAVRDTTSDPTTSGNTDYIEFSGKKIYQKFEEYDYLKNNITEETNDDWAYAIVDKKGILLFGIDYSGRVFFEKGLSSEVKKYVDDKIIEVSNFHLNDITNLKRNIQSVINQHSIDVQQHQSDIEEIYQKFTTYDYLKERIKEVSNNDWIYAIIDSNDTILFGINHDGQIFFDKGIPTEIQEKIDTFNYIKKDIKEETNDDWAYAIVDKKGILLFGIDYSGRVFFEKGLPSEIKEYVDNYRNLHIQELQQLENKHNSDIQNISNIQRENYQNLQEQLNAITRLQHIFDNEEYIYSIVDNDNKLLFGIRHNGTSYIPDVNKRFEELSGYQLVQNKEFIFAIVDSQNTVLFGIDYNGHSFVNGLSGVSDIKHIQNEEFIYFIKDSNDNIVFGIKKDGTLFASRLDLTDFGFFKSVDNNEFIHLITDKNGRIVFGIEFDGTSYIPKGIPIEQKSINKSVSNELKNLKYLIDNFEGGTGDWSDAESLEIPMPRCAKINLKTTIMPSAKSGLGRPGITCDIPCEMEFWDMNGNYFKKWILLSAQGNSSLSFIKKNIAIDLFQSKDDALNDGDTFKIKFGNWQAYDSYHLKAYYTDAFRGIAACVYRLAEQVYDTLPIKENRPYKYLYVNDENSTTKSSNKEINQTYDDNAYCHPLGFPVIVYQNNEFYGVYSFQIKKHRNNYQMNKKTTNHIHLDGTLSVDNVWNGNINWTQFEVRNPKSLYCMDGSKYNGDAPKELIDETSENYNSSNKDHKNTKAVKEKILNLSTYIGTLKAAENNHATNEEMRTLIASLFNVKLTIDYIVISQINNNTDGFSKNWQWTTWDGILWNPNLYDLDMSFGGHFVGNRLTSVPSSWTGNNKSIPSGWFIQYYLPEIKARYAELRNAKIFDTKNITNIIKDWLDSIGKDNFEKEYKKWPDSPCHRSDNVNIEYWQSTLSNPSNYSATTKYSTGGLCVKSSKVWKSLISNNLGNDPTLEENQDKWENVTWNAEKEYNVNDVCYYGRSSFYSFKCIKQCTNIVPVTKFYDTYPYELGYYDSIYRVQNWIAKRIEYLDVLLEYNEN